MAEFSRLVITKKGQALITKVLAGTAKDVEFTRIAASQAEFPSVDELENVTELPEIMQEAEISRKTQTNEVALKLETAFSNHDLTVGYPMNTLGLFAVDPDEGEILYAVTKEMSGNCYMPPYNGITVSGAYITLITTVGNADNVNLEVNPGAIATIGDIQELQKQITDIQTFIGLGAEGSVGHTAALITDENGVHGLRYYDNQFQVKVPNAEGEGDMWATANTGSGTGGGGGGGGGEDVSGPNVIKITFEAGFVGATFTVTDGAEDTKTGVVPESLVASVGVTNCNTLYTITATADNGIEYSTSVMTGAYYGQFTASLFKFNATISVTTVKGAVVTATCEGNSFQATADNNGLAVIGVNQAGSYSVTGTYSDVSSNSDNITVEENGGTYEATIHFIVLTVTSEVGATLALVNGDTTITITSTGQDVFYLPNTGTWTATLTSTEESATKTIKITGYQDYTLKVVFVSEILDENGWDKIKEVSDAGEGENYWAVGDTITVVLNGPVQGYTFNNLSVKAFILGFNHNAAKEGNNRIHFQIGKIGNAAVALCDSKYNSNGTDAGFRMNTSNTNSGGWNGSYMRKTVLGNDGTPTSPKTNSLMAAFPADLRAALKPTTKYTDNQGGGQNNASAVTATTDYIFLLAEFEVYGTRNYANSAEQTYQKQYDYYKAGNSRVAYNHSNTGSAVWWWLRSPNYNYGSYFREVHADGGSGRNLAYGSAGVRPGFSV